MDKEIFSRIDERDWLLFHPYHSFEPIINLLSNAARDPYVESIRATLYRVGNNSHVVPNACQGRRSGENR